MPLPPDTSDPSAAIPAAVSTPGGAVVPDSAPSFVAGLDSPEAAFRRDYPTVWAVTLFGPFVLTALLIGLVWCYAGWEFTRRLITSLALAIWLFGRFIILAGSDGTLKDVSGELSTEHLFLLMTYIDVMTALVLAFHLGFLFRFPVLGPRLAALMDDGHFILDHQPWMRRTAFLGLIAFIAFPLAATGSVGGSIFGRLLGMSRLATFLGIAIGTITGNGLMYLFSNLIGEYINKDHPVVKWGGIAVILLIVLLLERRYQTLRHRHHLLRQETERTNAAKHDSAA